MFKPGENMKHASLAMLVGVLIALFALCVLTWAGRIVSDPDDQCTDQSVPALARFISCSVEGR